VQPIYAAFDWLDYFQRSNDLFEVFDDYQATKPAWHKNSSYSGSLRSFIPNESNDVSTKLCGDKFYPAHPLANTKTYHYAKFRRYDLAKLPASSYSCRTTSNGRRKFCLAAGDLLFTVISDTFVDTCGNSFRGFWAVAYNSDDENMGTLLAKGRTIEPIPNSPFRHDYRPSNTYEVSRSDFIYFAPLFAKDKARIKTAIKTAVKEFKMIKTNNIFSKRP